MRTSVLSERVYSAKIERNPYAVTELRSIYRQLEADPRKVGVQMIRPDQAIEHWIYESPRMPLRARLRVYYTVHPAERAVAIQALDLL